VPGVIPRRVEVVAQSCGVRALNAWTCVQDVGEVGLRKPHPRSATLTAFGQHMASVSWRNLR
jgi:hypothetical protein